MLSLHDHKKLQSVDGGANRHMGLFKYADQIENAILKAWASSRLRKASILLTISRKCAQTIAEGKTITGDLGGKATTCAPLSSSFRLESPHLPRGRRTGRNTPRLSVRYNFLFYCKLIDLVLILNRETSAVAKL